LIDQDGVLIDPLPLDIDKPLADRLDESNPAKLPAERRKKPKRSGRFPVVLLRRSNENARRNGVQIVREKLKVRNF
jgi:hypothetical protein